LNLYIFLFLNKQTNNLLSETIFKNFKTDDIQNNLEQLTNNVLTIYLNFEYFSIEQIFFHFLLLNFRNLPHIFYYPMKKIVSLIAGIGIVHSELVLDQKTLANI
jgi:hypothetical protein